MGRTVYGDSFSFVLPDRVAVEEAAIVASDSIRLADGIKAGRMPSYVYCDGTGLTEIGADATVQAHVYTQGDQFLRDRTHILGKSLSAGSIETQNDVVVDEGMVSDAYIVRSNRYAWDVVFPEMGAGVNLEPDQSQDLAPGAYDFLGLKSRATIRLTAGTYYFNRFQTEPEGIIEVNSGGDAVIIYVRELVTSRASLVHSETSADFFIGYTGDQTVDLDGPYAGTVVAPNAEIRLAPLNGGRHEGQFIAKRFNAEARTPIDFVPYDHWDFAVDLCPAIASRWSPACADARAVRRTMTETEPQTVWTNAVSTPIKQILK